KEAVTKIARVAILYDPAIPATIVQLKDVQTAARALGLTIQAWEIRGTDDFDRVFAAMGKERPDGLYVLRSLLMNVNEKRIVGFALKSRLPSVYSNREAVEAGGLMYYGADFAESYRRVAYYRSEEHTSELQSRSDLVCRLLLEKKKKKNKKKRLKIKKTRHH